MRRGRPTKIRVQKRARLKAFAGSARRNARNPQQLKAAIMRDILRPRGSRRR